MPEFKKEGRGYKQKPFSGFKMMEEMMDNAPMMKKGKPTVSSKNKADKNIIESWKREFAKIADPMESNRGKALAEKLMDAGVDPSVYARPRNRKK